MFRDDPSCKETRQEKLIYLNTIRATITQLDGHRLSALSSGLALPSTLLVAAEAAFYYSFSNQPNMAELLINIARAFAMCSAGVFIIFMIKYHLFNEFIGDAVEIAKLAEADIGLDDKYSMTSQFQKHSLAGRRGRWIIYAILAILCAALAVFLKIRFIFTMSLPS